ncbi:hypothetical protein BKP45_07815 [Anaerobacillus alkalidiazotrophicus]|uniref:Uncharacterized protein n=1 Tax=Anaerobacillus alkalidiazotrophicus TaxID=472963 RepID=A0A1S2M7Z2_9BACI|nr:hypothetical protein [Anaerobacillus alkalidiazotrophicus]OIJ20868.1 hypothetical protein BKP45_07815 [Anaerobacillus alkalidiazotrophicus]
MAKRLIGFFILLALLSSCANDVEEQNYYLFAVSEHWKAEMHLTLPPPPEQTFEINIDFIYTGSDSNGKHKVEYYHILEWYKS